jgi:hypothetical protein
MPPAAKDEYTPEELDAREAQQAARPVYDVISGGVGAAMSYYDGPQETKAEYTPEELDVRDALYGAPELTPEELDQRAVDAKYDARVILSPEQLKEADELEVKLTEEGKRPGKWQMAKAIGGGILQSVADWNMALDKSGNLAAVVENALIKAGALDRDYRRVPMLEAALQAPASAKAGVQGTALNTTETVLALNNLAMGKPRYRVQETGEFVYAPLGGVAPLTQMAGEGKTLVPVTDADLDEHRYQLYAKENAIRSTYLDIMDEKLLGVKPNQSFTLPAEILLAPENLAPGFAATRVTGAARLGKLFSAKTLGAAEAAAGGSANIIDKGADVFTRAVQRMTFGALDRKTQSKIAKAAAYGGGAGAVATVMSGAPEEARNTALALMSLYPMYKMGSGVLRRVEGATGTAKMIMRESADATNGMDDVARAAVANNAAVPREIREALVNPSKFVPLESTPARIAKNEAFSPRVRQVAARLANPLIVQASRTAGAVGRGAVVGPLVNIPFAEAYREMGDEQTAEGIYGAGVLFGAGGGLVGRVAGARGRRRDAAVSDIGRMLVDIQQNNAGELGRAAPDRAFEVYYSMKEPGRMLTDVELAGGDIDALMRNTKFEDLAGMAAMQGFYRDSVDFIPLNGLDYDANVKALGGNGTAGYFLHAPEGQRARLFLNADARRTDVAPHEYGHALLASAAISPEMKNSARASINQRYGPEKLDGMAREYARNVVAGRNAREFPGQKMDVSEAEVDSILNELTENGLARGDADRLDWLRDEVFAEEHRAAGIDYAQIRRGIPAGFNPVGFAENVLGANARALAAAGAPIDPQTGKLQAPPDRLFKDNPILAADSVMRRNIRQYVSAYQQWLNDPAHEAPVGAPLSRAGNPNDLKNNPNVTFRDYGNGRLENELAFIDQDGNVKLKDKKNDPDRAKFIRARQQQVREMIDRGTKEPNDPTFGIRFRDGQRIVAGKTLPARFDLTRFPTPLKQLARRMESLGQAGETMQVRYFALGKSKDVFKQGDLRNAQAINREVMFVEWQATKDGNINAFVVDLTQFRNRAMKAIAQRDPSLAEINWDFKQLEGDLRRVLDNHANGRAGSDGIGPDRRNAVNALLGIGTKANRAANPLTGLGGKGSALKTLRLDAFDDIAGTGRQGFSFDYQKANGNFMPDRPAPRPDLDSDLPVRMPQQIPRSARGMPDVAASGRGDGMPEKIRAYRGISKSQPFNDSGTTWLTTSRDAAESYAKEVHSYDDPAVLEVLVDPRDIPVYDIRKLSEEQLNALEPDQFGNPQKIGIYRNSDDSMLGGSGAGTVMHVPMDRVEVVGGLPQDTPSAAPRAQAMPDAVGADAPPFYMKSAQVLDAKIQGRAATADQVRAILKNPQNGIKAEELKWTGIEQAVERIAKENGGKVPKEALLRYLAEDGAVRLEEVTLGAEGAELRKKLRVAANEMNEQMRLSGIPQKAMALGMSQLDAANLPARIIERKVAVDSLPAALQPDAQKYLETNQRYSELMRQAKDVPEPRYGSYQLPGGKNYREVVLAMPQKFEASKVTLAGNDEMGWQARLPNLTNYGYGDTKDSAVAMLRDRVESGEFTLNAYTSSHFNAPNYVAHMRLNERTDAAGKPGLFLEEIQSDRHQAGRERGYIGDPSAFTDMPEGYRIRSRREVEAPGDSGNVTRYWVETPEGNRVTAEQYSREAAVSEIVNTLNDQARGTTQSPIPDAPFRKDWPVQMFKRALADAVGSGKEWIGWTTGETQAARYDLSQHFDRIRVHKIESPADQAGWHVEASGNDSLRRVAKTDQELADTIGKELADKAIKQITTQVEKDAKLTQKQRAATTDDPYEADFTGVDLRVGGEGMKGFYDQILPKEISKYVKQWGAQVEKGTINPRQGKLYRMGDGMWQVERADGEVSTFANRDGAELFLRKGSTPIWRVNITPQMREGIKKAGQALFVGGMAAVVAEEELR